MRRSLAFALAALGVVLGLVASAPARTEQKRVFVFAAASLKNALDDVNRIWTRDAGKTATMVYAASNVLAKQIEAGAPADVFVSADKDWMDDAASKNLIRPQSRVDLLGNSLVLIAPNDARIASSSGSDIGSLLGTGRLAMGNVDAVPAGRYGKAALQHLGQWEDVKGRIAQAESVRAALLLVSRGEAPLGIVYRTDALSDPGVKLILSLPSDSHPAIVYPAAITTDSSHPDAAAFLAFLQSAEARRVFEGHGFVVNQPAPRS